jgi:hypothetical protein
MATQMILMLLDKKDIKNNCFLSLRKIDCKRRTTEYLQSKTTSDYTDNTSTNRRWLLYERKTRGRCH